VKEGFLLSVLEGHPPKRPSLGMTQTAWGDNFRREKEGIENVSVAEGRKKHA